MEMRGRIEMSKSFVHLSVGIHAQIMMERMSSASYRCQPRAIGPREE